MLRKINLNEEKKIMFLKVDLNLRHSGQVWSSQNQMKNVKRAANWAIGELVELCSKLENSSMFA